MNREEMIANNRLAGPQCWLGNGSRVALVYRAGLIATIILITGCSDSHQPQSFELPAPRSSVSIKVFCCQQSENTLRMAREVQERRVANLHRLEKLEGAYITTLKSTLQADLDLMTNSPGWSSVFWAPVLQERFTKVFAVLRPVNRKVDFGVVFVGQEDFTEVEVRALVRHAMASLASLSDARWSELPIQPYLLFREDGVFGASELKDLTEPKAFIQQR